MTSRLREGSRSRGRSRSRRGEAEWLEQVTGTVTARYLEHGPHNVFKIAKLFPSASNRRTPFASGSGSGSGSASDSATVSEATRWPTEALQKRTTRKGKRKRKKRSQFLAI